ncbi:MAG: hypothetical protein AABM66_11825 [Actinomycetota bacterium]
MARVGEVFVPGGLPSITYNPREELKLEQRVRDYLDQRHRVLSLSGPTKSGKTVLLRTVVAESISISGGSISSVNEFWEAVVDHTGGYTEIGIEASDTESAGSVTGGGVSGGMPGLAQAEGQHSRSRDEAQTTSDTRSRRRPPHIVAAEGLKRVGLPLIIDDFHYMNPDIQVAVIRGLKELVFDGAPVILASVPHRAFDAVRVEREMTGRVEQLEIRFWSPEELRGIAETGFEALNVTVAEAIVKRLIEESFSSPHLMQDFCLALCIVNDVRETESETRELQAPNWIEFFQERASSASKTAFELLAQGPRQRADRIERVLKDGTTTDIYGAVLAGIAATGPVTALDYTDLRSSLREIMADPPQTQEVTRVLEIMSNIARDKIEGEPVVDYDQERSALFISDPFFAYYLRWGTDPPLAAVRETLRP